VDLPRGEDGAAIARKEKDHKCGLNEVKKLGERSEEKREVDVPGENSVREWLAQYHRRMWERGRGGKKSSGVSGGKKNVFLIFE